MAMLQCEVCGGKLVGKPEGIFECEYCGVQYDTSWAKAKIQEIKGTVQVEGTVEVTGTVKVEGSANLESFLKRGKLALEDKDWDRAKEFFDQALNINAECGEAYLGLAMTEMNESTEEDFVFRVKPDNKNYIRAKQNADKELLDKLEILEKNAKEKRMRLAPIRKRINSVKNIISAGHGCTVGLNTNGTVVVAGECEDVSEYYNIVAIAAGAFHAVGLKADGTVVATGLNNYGRRNVSNWNNVVAIAAGDDHAVGLKADGTVVATGDNSEAQCNVSKWNNIAAIAAGNYCTVGLKSNGTVVVTEKYHSERYGYDLSELNNIVAIAAGHHHIVGLKSDDTVVATGTNNHGCCNVSKWRNVAAIAAGEQHTVGLKLDGTVVATGDNSRGQCDVSKWNNIVAIAAGEYHTVGLKSDGTVVFTGTNNRGCCNVSDWKLFDNMDNLEEERKIRFEEGRNIAEAAYQRRMVVEWQRHIAEERERAANRLCFVEVVFTSIPGGHQQLLYSWDDGQEEVLRVGGTSAFRLHLGKHRFNILLPLHKKSYIIDIQDDKTIYVKEKLFSINVDF